MTANKVVGTVHIMKTGLVAERSLIPERAPKALRTISLCVSLFRIDCTTSRTSYVSPGDKELEVDWEDPEDETRTCRIILRIEIVFLNNES